MLAYVIVVFCCSSPVPWMVQAAAAPVSERQPASLRADALDTRGASAGAPLLAAVAAVLPLAVAIFGCVARNGGNGDAGDGGGDELKRLKRKLLRISQGTPPAPSQHRSLLSQRPAAQAASSAVSQSNLAFPLVLLLSLSSLFFPTLPPSC